MLSASRIRPRLDPPQFTGREPGERPTNNYSPASTDGDRNPQCRVAVSNTAEKVQPKPRSAHTAGIRAVALLISGDPAQTSTIVTTLRDHGFDVLVAPTAPAALALPAGLHIDLVVLSTPSQDVPALCQELQDRFEASILILGRPTTAPEVNHRCRRTRREITHDELTDPTQIVLCAEALIRDHPARTSHAVVTIGKLTLDPTRRTARFADQPIHLSYIEYRLLAHLATHAGTPQTWRQLMRAVWETDDQIGGCDIVKSTIYRLRGRLAAVGADTDYIQTLRGVGYLTPKLPPAES